MAQPLTTNVRNAAKALAERCPGYRFGYNDYRTAGLALTLSVSSQNFSQNVLREGVEHGLSPQAYADLYIEMLKELSANVDPTPTPQ